MEQCWIAGKKINKKDFFKIFLNFNYQIFKFYIIKKSNKIIVLHTGEVEKKIENPRLLIFLSKRHDS